MCTKSATVPAWVSVRRNLVPGGASSRASPRSSERSRALPAEGGTGSAIRKRSRYMILEQINHDQMIWSWFALEGEPKMFAAHLSYALLIGIGLATGAATMLGG